MMMWIRCAMHGRAASTGIEIDAVAFEQLPDRLPDFHCPVCGTRHEWQRRDAWLADRHLTSPEALLEQRLAHIPPQRMALHAPRPRLPPRGTWRLH